MACIIKYKGKEYSYQEYVKMLYEGKIKSPQFQITTGGRPNKPVEESVQKKIDEYISDNSLDENTWALLDEEGKTAQKQGIFDRITEFAKDTDYFKTDKDKQELKDHISEVLTDKYKNAEKLAGRTNTMSSVEGKGKKAESGFSKNLRKNTIDPFLKKWANNNRMFHKRQSNEESVALAMDTIARETESALADLAKE